MLTKPIKYQFLATGFFLDRESYNAGKVALLTSGFDVHLLDPADDGAIDFCAMRIVDDVSANEDLGELSMTLVNAHEGSLYGFATERLR